MASVVRVVVEPAFPPTTSSTPTTSPPPPLLYHQPPPPPLLRLHRWSRALCSRPTPRSRDITSGLAGAALLPPPLLPQSIRRAALPSSVPR